MPQRALPFIQQAGIQVSFLSFLIFLDYAYNYPLGHIMRTSTPLLTHSGSQRMYQHPSLGSNSSYSGAAQPVGHYTSPQGVLVEGMRGPGLTPQDASQYHTTSFPVIPEDQQPNARYVCATCNKRFNRPSSLRVSSSAS